MKRLLIVGGGITGLAAALHASRASGLEITLVESGDRLGGKIRTDTVDGYILDEGPDSFVASKPEILRL